MALKRSEDMLICSMEQLCLTSSERGDAEDIEIIPYKDLLAALEESRRKHTVKRSTEQQDEDSNHCDDPTLSASTEGSDPGSFASLFSDSSRKFRSFIESPPTSLYYSDDSEGESKSTRFGLPYLVEFGVKDLALELSRAEESYTRIRNRSVPICYERPSNAFGLTGCGDESNDLRRGSIGGHNELEPRSHIEVSPCLKCSEEQLELFGDFLSAPFAAATSECSRAIGISPFDTEEHSPCDCEKCLLVEFALSRELSDPHPVASWLEDHDPDSD